MANVVLTAPAVQSWELSRIDQLEEAVQAVEYEAWEERSRHLRETADLRAFARLALPSAQVECVCGPEELEPCLVCRIKMLLGDRRAAADPDALHLPGCRCGQADCPEAGAVANEADIPF